MTTIELDDQAKSALRDALEAYLSDLREEIVKTEKHEWREALHRQKDILTDIQRKLH
jgi:histone H3/H4